MTLYDFFNCYRKFFLQPFEDFLILKKAYKNYFHVILKKKMKSYPITAEFRKGTTVTIENNHQYLVSKWFEEKICRFENNMIIIKKRNLPEIKFLDWEDNGDLSSVFLKEDYNSLPVKGNYVVDIGANIGDSSIYFALKGANKVFAFEPLPKNFESAKKNIQLNHQSQKIELSMSGCGSKNGTIKINSQDSGVLYSLQEDVKNQIEVPVITLAEILKRNNLDSCILKIDCEGCEYDLILSTSCETLKKFSHILIEYHFGYINLKKKLEKCGFKVVIDSPKIGLPISQYRQRVYSGYLFAEKV